jgi:hypothetical protein
LNWPPDENAFNAAPRYKNTPGSPNLSPNLPEPFSGEFPHLFGFLQDQFAITDGVTSSSQAWGAPSLHRLLDFVEVPSPYAFALNSFRYPGKINLNTIGDDRVYAALQGSYFGWLSQGNLEQEFINFDDSKRRIELGTSFPTEIPFPFRSSFSANLVPEQSMVVRSAQPTILRGAYPDNPAKPLFGPSSENPPDNLAMNYDRSSYFRNIVRQRLANLTTTRSSVFAVWVTVGFFEVDQNNGMILSEVGLEDGSAQRHRGFFMVDRSIPVAFEPGKNHDVEDCVLIESIIERQPSASNRGNR